MNRSALSLTLELRIIDIMGTGRGKGDLSRENGFIAGLKEALELIMQNYILYIQRVNL